jgi:hypothetical protein
VPEFAAAMKLPNKKNFADAGLGEIAKTAKQRKDFADAVKFPITASPPAAESAVETELGPTGESVDTGMPPTWPQQQPPQAPTAPVESLPVETAAEPELVAVTQPDAAVEQLSDAEKQALRERGADDLLIDRMPPDLARRIIESPPVEDAAESVKQWLKPTEAEPTPPPKKSLGRRKDAPVEPSAAPANESNMDRLKRERREQENARNIRTGNGESPSQAKGWLQDAINRRPETAQTPAEIAQWMEKGFSNSHYWKLLKQDGVTLEEAVAREMQPAAQPLTPEQQRIADGTKRIGDTYQPPAPTVSEPTTVDPFVSSMTPMARKKATDALDKTVSHNGKVMPRRQMIEQAIERGGKVVAKRTVDTAARNRLQAQADRMASTVPFNESHPERIKYNEIREQLKDGGPYKEERRLEFPSGTFMTEGDTSKTAMDYAAHLLSTPSVAPPDRQK